MVNISLYAQPFGSEPYLNMSTFGTVEDEESEDYENIKALTDVGRFVCETAQSMDDEASIAGTSMEGSSYEWGLRIEMKNLIINMKSKSYTPEPLTVKDHVIKLNFSGEDDSIESFVQGLVKNLKRYPFEINDWDALKKTEKVTKDDVIKNWEKYLGGKTEEIIKEDEAVIPVEPLDVEPGPADMEIPPDFEAPMEPDMYYGEGIEEPLPELSRKKKKVKLKVKKKVDKISTRPCPKCKTVVQVDPTQDPIVFKCPSCGLRGKFKRKKKEIEKPEPKIIETLPEAPPEEVKPEPEPEPEIPPVTKAPPEEVKPEPEPKPKLEPEIPPETKAPPEKVKPEPEPKPELESEIPPETKAPSEEVKPEPEPEIPPVTKAPPEEVKPEPEPEIPPVTKAPPEEVKPEPKAEPKMPPITKAPPEEVKPEPVRTAESEVTKIIEYLDKAERFKNRNQYHDAIQYYDLVLDIDPENIQALNNKGIILWANKKYKLAIELFDNVLELDKKNEEAMINKAASLNKLGEKEAAIDIYDDLIKINKKNSDAWSNKGVILFTLKLYSEAEDCFRNAVKYELEDEDYWLNFAVILEKNGKFEEAVDAYEKVIKLNPVNQEAIRGYEACVKEVRRNILKDWKH